MVDTTKTTILTTMATREILEVEEEDMAAVEVAVKVVSNKFAFRTHLVGTRIDLLHCRTQAAPARPRLAE